MTRKAQYFGNYLEDITAYGYLFCMAIVFKFTLLIENRGQAETEFFANIVDRSHRKSLRVLIGSIPQSNYGY